MIPKLIIFDFDGTLCDTRQNIIKAFRATMQALGLPLRDEETCGATIGLTLRDGFAELYPTFSGTELDTCVVTYRRIFAEHREEYMPELFPGVREVLEKLYGRGCKLAIASSRLSDSLLLFMRAHAIEHYFSFVVGADSVTRHKPDAEPVTKCLEHYGVDATEALVVGDMPVDVGMAHNAGVRAVAVSYGNASRAELEASRADAIIDDIGALIDYLD